MKVSLALRRTGRQARGLNILNPDAVSISLLTHSAPILLLQNKTTHYTLSHDRQENHPGERVRI